MFLPWCNYLCDNPFFFHLGVGNSNNHLNHPLRDFFIKLDQKALTVSCQLPSCVWRRGVFCHNWSSKSFVISTLISYGCVLIQESDSFYLCLCHIHHVAFMSLWLSTSIMKWGAENVDFIDQVWRECPSCLFTFHWPEVSHVTLLIARISEQCSLWLKGCSSNNSIPWERSGNLW